MIEEQEQLNKTINTQKRKLDNTHHGIRYKKQKLEKVADIQKNTAIITSLHVIAFSQKVKEKRMKNPFSDKIALRSKVRRRKETCTIFYDMINFYF